MRVIYKYSIPTSQKVYCTSITMINHFQLSREIIAVFESAERWVLKPVGFKALNMEICGQHQYILYRLLPKHFTLSHRKSYVYRIIVQGYWTGLLYKVIVQGYCTGVLNRVIVQGYWTGLLYRVIVQGYCTRLLYRVTVQGYCTGLLYKVIVQGY
jgi:hypothetical protein